MINGWQNISEDDSNKALGSAIRYSSEAFLLSYTNFFGKYLQKAMQFHDLNIIVPISKKLEIKSLFDIGIRENSSNETKKFYTFNLQGYYRFNAKNAASLRYELYEDPESLNVLTPIGTGFEVNALSVGYDRNLGKDFLWRAEYKHLISDDNIFASESALKDSNNFIVFSLASRF